MSAPCAVIASVIFSWLGLVVGSYFIEVPLKYIVASASLQTSRWIEWPVLRALDVAEIVMADVVVTAILAGQVPVGVMGAAGVVVTALTIQRLVVRPWPCQRLKAWLAGIGPAAQGSSHQWRVLYADTSLETVKVVALAFGGAIVMAT